MHEPPPADTLFGSVQRCVADARVQHTAMPAVSTPRVVKDGKWIALADGMGCLALCAQDQLIQPYEIQCCEIAESQRQVAEG